MSKFRTMEISGSIYAIPESSYRSMFFAMVGQKGEKQEGITVIIGDKKYDLKKCSMKQFVKKVNGFSKTLLYDLMKEGFSVPKYLNSVTR